MTAGLLMGCVSLFVQPYGQVAADKEASRADGRPVVMPRTAPSISQGYRPERFDVRALKTSGGHQGIDIIADTGTPVMATAAGVVVQTGFNLFYGDRVTIQHGRDAQGRDIQSRYFHLKAIWVRQGDPVVRGQPIGSLGRTGLLAGFPHLHYEIRVRDSSSFEQWASVNPHRFWAEGAGVVTCFDVDRSWPEQPFQITYPVPCRGVAWH